VNCTPLSCRRARTRSAIAAVVSISGLYGCSGHQLPTESYAFPTAVIGIAIKSAEDAPTVYDTFKNFAQHSHLMLVAPFPDESIDRLCPRGHEPGRCTVVYSPRYPTMREGFGMDLGQLSDRCFIVRLFDYSGSWTSNSLDALQHLREHLAAATATSAPLLVRPKSGHNWPAQNTFHDPEVPERRAEFCTLLGLPNPEVPGT
jgi:hypothetical protein